MIFGRLKSINTKPIGLTIILLATVLYYRFFIYATPRIVSNYCWYDQSNNKQQIPIDCIACYNFQNMKNQRGYINILVASLQIASEIIYQTECIEYQCKQISTLNDFKYLWKESENKLSKFGFTKKIYGDGSKRISFAQQNQYYGFIFRFRYLQNKKLIEDIQKPIVTINSVPNSLHQRIIFSAFGMAVWSTINPIFLFGFINHIFCTILSVVAVFIILMPTHCIGICLISPMLWIIGIQDEAHPLLIQLLSIILIMEQFIIKSYKGKQKFYFMNYWHYLMIIGVVYVCSDKYVMVTIYTYIPQILYFLSKLEGLNLQQQHFSDPHIKSQARLKIQSSEEKEHL